MRYEIKFSSGSSPNVTKKTISFISGNQEARKIKNDISFSSKIDGGQEQLVLEINTDFNDETYEQWDIVRIRNFTDFNKQWQQIYFGFIDQIERDLKEREQGVVLRCLGIASLMKRILFTRPPGGWWDPIPRWWFTPSVTITECLTEIINNFNSRFPVPLITIWSIPVTTQRTTIWFNGDNCLDLIREVLSQTDWFFYIGPDWVFNTGPVSNTPDNILVMKKQILTLSFKEQRNDITNRLWGTYFDWLASPIILYEDLPSQAQYWIIESYADKREVFNTQDDLDNFANAFLEENKNPKQQLSFVLSPEADFNEVKPGNIVRIKNVDFTLTDAKVVRVRFGSSKTTVDCEKSITIGDAIVNA